MTRPQLTNRLGLPEPLIRAIQRDSYDSKGSDITVTSLLRPPRQVALEKLHWREVVEDAEEKIWGMIGKLGHLVLQLASEGTDDLTEHRCFTKRLGWKISGQFDLWKRDQIVDYKFTKAWSIKTGAKIDWTRQVNMLAWLARLNGIQVKSGQIVCILMDFSKAMADKSKDYPQAQVQVFDIQMWSDEQVASYVDLKILEHQAARHELPLCSDEDRWFRGGRYVRCQSYCRMAPYCEQFLAPGNPKQNTTPCDRTGVKGAD